MRNISTKSDRSDFFPKAKLARSGKDILGLRKNSIEKKREIELTTKDDIKIDIPSRVKDFARIKSAVDRAHDIDKSDKVLELKKRIQNGSYNVDYDALADRMISSEF